MDTCLLIDFLLAHLLVEVFFHHAEGVRVAICHRVAKDSSVLAHIYEVASPSVDADTLDRDVALCNEFQTLDDFVVESIDVPIEMTTCLDEVVVETCQLLQVKLSIRQTADDGSSTRSSQVNCEEIFFLFHYNNVGFKLLHFSLAKLGRNTDRRQEILIFVH